MELVRKTRTGNIVWKDAATRNQAIQDELDRRGYTVKVGTEDLGHMYYISRSATRVTKQLERTFRSKTQLDKYLREWNRYDRMYDTINVVDRDVIAGYAADRLLNV